MKQVLLSLLLLIPITFLAQNPFEKFEPKEGIDTIKSTCIILMPVGISGVHFDCEMNLIEVHKSWKTFQYVTSSCETCADAIFVTKKETLSKKYFLKGEEIEAWRILKEDIYSN